MTSRLHHPYYSVCLGKWGLWKSANVSGLAKIEHSGSEIIPKGDNGHARNGRKGGFKGRKWSCRGDMNFILVTSFPDECDCRVTGICQAVVVQEKGGNRAVREEYCSV